MCIGVIGLHTFRQVLHGLFNVMRAGCHTDIFHICVKPVLERSSFDYPLQCLTIMNFSKPGKTKHTTYVDIVLEILWTSVINFCVNSYTTMQTHCLFKMSFERVSRLCEHLFDQISFPKINNNEYSLQLMNSGCKWNSATCWKTWKTTDG